MTQAPLRHFFYRQHSCQDKQEPLQHPSRPTKPGWPGWHFGLTALWDDGYFSLSAGPLSLKLEKKTTQLSGSCIFWLRGFFGLLCNLPRINIILKLVTKTHSQSWLRTEGECLHARAENPVGRKQYQLSVNMLNPVQTDRKRNTASQNLHKWHAGWQLHASCPRSWRCHWGIHGELQKRERKKKPRCLTTYSKLPSLLLSYTVQKHQSVQWGGSPTTTTLWAPCSRSLFHWCVSLA